MPIGHGQRSSYLVWVRAGSIRLFDGPCAGERLRLDPGASYSIALTAVDAYGNESPAQGGRLKVVVPDRPANGRTGEGR